MNSSVPGTPLPNLTGGAGGSAYAQGGTAYGAPASSTVGGFTVNRGLPVWVAWALVASLILLAVVLWLR